jgi:hypothetical protein
MSEEIKETAGGELTQGEFKIKKKPKKLVNSDQPVVKLDLSKKEEPKEETVTKVEIKNEETEQENPISEVVKEEPKEEKVEEVTQEIKEEPKRERIVELPTDLKKVVDFMEETGGSLQDYVRLNQDYSKLDETTLLREYYKNTKPHLDSEEIDFIMEDNFHYDEEVDEDRDIRKKKLARKEEIAKARNFLEETKNKYYEEIKLKPKVNEDQQKALDFFNRYNDRQQHLNKQKEEFVSNTKEYFSKDFKGFEFNLGEKTFNYNVNNTEDLVKKQSELQAVVKKFLNEDGNIEDLKGYHKALYAAQNADTIAKHFYEQGKADGIKNIVNKSKNIDAASRPQNNEAIYINGLRVKAVNGVDSSKLKIQKRKK